MTATMTRLIPTIRPEMKSYMNRGKPSGPSTPWGKADMQRCFAPGFIQVGTPSHGGFGITKSFAAKAGITEAALKRAEFSNGRFWFEEDCAYAILAWELGRDWWPVLFSNGYESDVMGGSALLDATNYSGRNPIMGRMSIRLYLRQTLSAWNADYLQETGAVFELTEPQYGIWLARQEDERLRREHSPLLITSAMYKDGPEVEVYGEPVTLVYTADGRHHVVRRSSYAVRTPNLLADCDILDSDVAIDFH